jgi:DNA-binding response OmpR family regulator
MARLLDQAFRESGFDVQVAQNGREGLKVANEFDALVVDVMMPAMNGFEMVRALRANACRVPVLFLTAKDSIPDRVQGLEIGGDDYLLKPFALEELLARVRALIRRARDGQDILQYADLWIDRRDRKARRGQEWLFLSNTEFMLLETFMLSPGIPMSKAALLREVWHEQGVRDDNIVEVYVSYLRGKTEFMGKLRLLHTVRGVGYVLEDREE